MKQEDLKRMIMEELGRLREEMQFDGLEVSALDDAGDEVVRMVWTREPAAAVAQGTLLAQLELSTVKRLMVHKGEEWIEANLPMLADDVRVDYPEDEPRFTDDQMDRDRQLGGYGDEDSLDEVALAPAMYQALKAKGQLPPGATIDFRKGMPQKKAAAPQAQKQAPAKVFLPAIIQNLQGKVGKTAARIILDKFKGDDRLLQMLGMALRSSR